MIKEKSKTWAFISAQIGAIFSNLPFSPNCYTWLTLPAAIIGLLFMVYHHIAMGVIFFALAGILDLIDGALARHLNQTTHGGAFLDGSLDRFVDFLLIFSYFWLPMQTPFFTLGQWISIAYFFAIMPSFIVAYANHRRAVEDPEEKIIWRILNRGEMYIMMLFIPILCQVSPKWAGYLLIALVTLSIITTLQTIFLTMRLATD